MSGSIGGGGHNSQDFELNLASIIDCFTVLIAFMLVSSAFLSIGILDAGIAAAGTTSTNATPPAVNIAVELNKNQTFEIKVTGKATSNVKVARGKTEEGWDFDALSQQLQAMKGKWPDVQALTVTAENKIEYREIVKTIETARKTHPAVVLGGF